MGQKICQFRLENNLLQAKLTYIDSGSGRLWNCSLSIDGKQLTHIRLPDLAHALIWIGDSHWKVRFLNANDQVLISDFSYNSMYDLLCQMDEAVGEETD